VAVFPSVKLKELLDAGQNAPTAKAKGDALEEAICVCLESLAGVEVIARNSISQRGSFEIDVVIHNNKSAAKTAVAFLNSIVLVECKNWERPVDCKTIRDFLHKVTGAKEKVGILIAANGITGDAQDVTRGHDVLRQAFDNDGTKILVITAEEIRSLTNSEELVVMLRNKFTNYLLRKKLF
jgi:Holliday junction resolvase-like predicted endonuclease